MRMFCRSNRTAKIIIPAGYKARLRRTILAYMYRRPTRATTFSDEKTTARSIIRSKCCVFAGFGAFNHFSKFRPNLRLLLIRGRLGTRNMGDEPELRRLLWFLLGASRGGRNRARIIWRLREKPSNQNQLANDLGVQYKGIQHHVKVLSQSSMIIGTGEKYGVTYTLSPWLESRFDIFEEVCRKLSLDVGGAA